MRKALRIAGSVLRGGAVAVALSAAAFMVVPRLLGWQVVTVLSGSMAPTYPVDSVLAVRPVNSTDVHKGDVIAFVVAADRPMVTHRVIAIDTSAGQLSFTTKGDANATADQNPVPASAVRGRVVVGIPHLGTFVRAVHDPWGFALLLLLPGTLLIGQEILTMRRARRPRTTRTATSPTTATPADEPTDETSSLTDSGQDDLDLCVADVGDGHHSQALDHEVKT
jgi:signal peptidase